jgi:predicted dehydrogenase
VRGQGNPVDLDLHYRPNIGKKTDFRIGVIGCGGIVRGAHLPAYRKAGFRVTGIWNRTIETARTVAEDFGIPRVYGSWQELVASADVDIVDISLPPHLHPAVAIGAMEEKKHVMVQKPMATTYADAVRMVEAARRCGVKLAVNQNGRWEPSIRASRTLIERGLLGTRLTAFIELRTQQPWQPFWEDRAVYRRLMLLGMSVHHVDQFRFLFGDPAYVSALTATAPGQKWEGDAIAHYQLQYGDGFFASALDDGATWTRDVGVRFRFTGTEGVIKGTMGWPLSTWSTLRYTSKEMEEDWREPTFTTQWFPDAFIGTMADLFIAIEKDGTPSISGEDNLKTLQAVFACYRSARERRSVRPEEITGKGEDES